MRPRDRVLIAIAVVGALGLRVAGLRYGLPAVYNPDEVAITSRALAFAKGDLNPHNFLYPTFYFYVLFAWQGLTAVLAVVTRQVASFGAFEREFFLDPTRVYVAGRLLTALLGTATVYACWTLARRLGLGAGALWAAVFLAVAPLHVRDSHYIKHDVPVTLLIVLSYAACARVWDRRGSLVLAAAVTGAAFATHYYAIFLAIPLAWSAARGARTTAEAVRRIALAAAVSAAVFFALSPFAILEPHTALRDIRANRQIVVDRAVGGLGYAATLARYAVLLVRDTAGWPVVVLAAAGLVVAFRRDWRRASWLLSFAVPFFLFIAGTVPATRYLVPVVPFLAILAGWAVDDVDRRSRAFATALAVACAAWPAVASVRTDLFIRQADTRTLAAEYLEKIVPSGTTVLVQPYSVVLQPTREVLEEAVRRTGREMPTKTRLQIERVPYPAPSYRLLWLGSGLDADKIYVTYEQLSGSDPLRAARNERVAYVVWKRYNKPDPATLPFLSALAREGRRIAVFSPYRDAPREGGGDTRPEPFLHNTDTRITGALERPGPVMEIWQLDGPGS